jgi:hypothetical protein
MALHIKVLAVVSLLLVAFSYVASPWAVEKMKCAVTGFKNEYVARTYLPGDRNKSDDELWKKLTFPLIVDQPDPERGMMIVVLDEPVVSSKFGVVDRIGVLTSTVDFVGRGCPSSLKAPPTILCPKTGFHVTRALREWMCAE